MYVFNCWSSTSFNRLGVYKTLLFINSGGNIFLLFHSVEKRSKMSQFSELFFWVNRVVFQVFRNVLQILMSKAAPKPLKYQGSLWKSVTTRFRNLAKRARMQNGCNYCLDRAFWAHESSLQPSAQALSDQTKNKSFDLNFDLFMVKFRSNSGQKRSFQKIDPNFSFFPSWKGQWKLAEIVDTIAELKKQKKSRFEIFFSKNDLFSP